MDVHPIRIKRQTRPVNLLVINCNKQQVDVRLCPNLVVGQAPAKDSSQYRSVLFHLLDQRIERGSEILLDRLLFHWLLVIGEKTASRPGTTLSISYPSTRRYQSPSRGHNQAGSASSYSQHAH